MSRKPPQPCGTESAYRRHLYRGETPCEECRAAAVAAQRRRYRAKHPAREPAPCGTRAGYTRHWRAGEAACCPCRAAAAAYQQSLRKKAA